MEVNQLSTAESYIANETLRCPLTEQIPTNPVVFQNVGCPHCFEKEALDKHINDLVVSNKIAMHVTCPHTGKQTNNLTYQSFRPLSQLCQDISLHINRPCSQDLALEPKEIEEFCNCITLIVMDSEMEADPQIYKRLEALAGELSLWDLEIIFGDILSRAAYNGLLEKCLQNAAETSRSIDVESHQTSQELSEFVDIFRREVGKLTKKKLLSRHIGDELSQTIKNVELGKLIKSQKEIIESKESDIRDLHKIVNELKLYAKTQETALANTNLELENRKCDELTTQRKMAKVKLAYEKKCEQEHKQRALKGLLAVGGFVVLGGICLLFPPAGVAVGAITSKVVIYAVGGGIGGYLVGTDIAQKKYPTLEYDKIISLYKPENT